MMPRAAILVAGVRPLSAPPLGKIGYLPPRSLRLSLSQPPPPESLQPHSCHYHHTEAGAGRADI
jgi:hypothetical protein